MNRAVISGDIVAYTSLLEPYRIIVDNTIQDVFTDIKKDFDTYNRVVKGDSIECYVPDPANSLRIALLFKSKIKSISKVVINPHNDNRIKAFKTFGVRIAVGIGDISRFDPKAGIIDGSAIYYSGRTLSNMGTTSNKSRIVIKNTFCLKSSFKEIDMEFQPVFQLLDIILSNASAKQCEVLYYKLMKLKDDEIASKLDIKQNTVSEHSMKVGWYAIERTIDRFEFIQKKY